MSASSRRRFGFTLVELLVVITIIGMLVALLIPAVQAARARMLQTQCSNNLRNLGQAMINYASGKGNLPGYVQPVQRLGSSGKFYVECLGSGINGSFYDNTLDRNRSRVSWAAILLPKLEREDLWQNLTDANVVDPARTAVRPIDVFTCPVDTDALSSPDNAGLSYVVNAGRWDWDDMGNYYGDTAENGMFHNLTLGKVTSRWGNINDGSGTTLMLAENKNKNNGYSWLGVANGEPGEQHFGMVWVSPVDAKVQYDPTNSLYQVDATPASAADFSIRVQEPIGQESVVNFRSDAPRFARPSSNHPAGSFNVIFADGHAESLDPGIDYVIYQQLLTPYGRNSSDPVNGPGDAISVYQAAPPLSENDY